MRVGLLTGGGDCPGLNAAIRAIVLCAANDGDEVIGFHHVGGAGILRRHTLDFDGLPFLSGETIFGAMHVA